MQKGDAASNPITTTKTETDAHTHTISIHDNNSTHTHNIAVQNQVGGGTETRPRNVALLACIKY